MDNEIPSDNKRNKLLEQARYWCGRVKIDIPHRPLSDELPLRVKLDHSREAPLPEPPAS